MIRPTGSKAVFLLFALPILIPACSSSSESQATSIGGVLTDTSGQAVPGALVKASSSELGLAFLVVTGSDGSYQTPALLPGSYTVQGFGEGVQSELSGPLSVDLDQRSNLDLILSKPHPLTPIQRRQTFEHYAALMPEGVARELIQTRCTLCHGLDRVVPTRHTPEIWEKSVDRMRAFLNSRADMLRENDLPPISEPQSEQILDYVSEHFSMEAPRLPRPKGPDDPEPHLSRVGTLKGAEAKVVSMEFVPKSESRRFEIGIDSKGTAWITEGGTETFASFDPETLTYQTRTPPPGDVPRALAQIAADPQDQIWILDNGPTPDAELLQYNPQSGEFQAFPIKAPPGLRAPLNTIRFLDGQVWGTGNASSRVVKLDPATGEISAYASPGGSHPYGIDIGSDRAVWYIGNYDNSIVRVDPDTGQMTQYKTPGGFGLRRMGADAQGHVWVGAQDADKLVRLDVRTGEIKAYDVPTQHSGPYSVDVDKERNLVWVSLRDANKIARFDPETETFSEFSLPTDNSQPRRILVDPSNPNRVWWGASVGRFGYVEVFE